MLIMFAWTKANLIGNQRDMIKISLRGGSVFTFLAAEWLLYHSARLMIKRGSGCRQNCPQLPRGWVRVCANVRWPHAVVLRLAARNPVHGPCAVPHALPCPAVYIRYVSGNGNVRKLHQHRELFQVSTALLFASPCAPGSWHCFGSLFVSSYFFFQPELLLSDSYWGGKQGKELKTQHLCNALMLLSLQT